MVNWLKAIPWRLPPKLVFALNSLKGIYQYRQEQSGTYPLPLTIGPYFEFRTITISKGSPSSRAFCLPRILYPESIKHCST